jgi:Smg protein
LGDLPDIDSLSRHLSAVGFDTGEIDQAVDWLCGLTSVSGTIEHELQAAGPDSIRCYAAEEEQQLDRDARGYLYFLESAGVLDSGQREVVLDRIAALNDSEIELDQVKLIVLMVLWSQGPRPDHLIFEELFASHNWRSLH